MKIRHYQDDRYIYEYEENLSKIEQVKSLFNQIKDKTRWILPMLRFCIRVIGKVLLLGYKLTIFIMPIVFKAISAIISIILGFVFLLFGVIASLLSSYDYNKHRTYW